MANGLASMMMQHGYDPADPKVGMMLDRINKNPNLLPQSGLTWQQLIALNGEVQRLKQKPQAPPAPTVATQLEGERRSLSQGLPTAMPSGSQMYDPAMYQQGIAANTAGEEAPVAHGASGGVVAFANGKEVKVPEEAESAMGKWYRERGLAREKDIADYAQYMKTIQDSSTMPWEAITPTERTRREALRKTLDPDAPRSRPAINPLIPNEIGGTGVPFPSAPPRAVARELGSVAPPVAPTPEPESAGLKMLADLRAKREKELVEAKVPSLDTFVKQTAEAYKSQGIGDADAKEKARLDAKELARKDERVRDRWFNISEGLFAIGATKSPYFMQAASEGGAKIAGLESATNKEYRKLQNDMDEQFAKIAHAEELRKAGYVDKAMSQRTAAEGRLAKARENMDRLDERGAELQYGKEVTQSEGNLTRANQLKIARIQAAVSGARNLSLDQSFVKDMNAAVATNDQREIDKVLARYQRMAEAVNPQKFVKPEDQLIQILKDFGEKRAPPGNGGFKYLGKG